MGCVCPRSSRVALREPLLGAPQAWMWALSCLGRPVGSAGFCVARPHVGASVPGGWTSEPGCVCPLPLCGLVSLHGFNDPRAHFQAGITDSWGAGWSQDTCHTSEWGQKQFQQYKGNELLSRPNMTFGVSLQYTLGSLKKNTKNNTGLGQPRVAPGLPPQAPGKTNGFPLPRAGVASESRAEGQGVLAGDPTRPPPARGGRRRHRSSRGPDPISVLPPTRRYPPACASTYSGRPPIAKGPSRSGVTHRGGRKVLEGTAWPAWPPPGLQSPPQAAPALPSLPRGLLPSLLCTSPQPAPGDTTGPFPGVRGTRGGPFLEAHLQASLLGRGLLLGGPHSPEPLPGSGHCGYSAPCQHCACIKQTASPLSSQEPVLHHRTPGRTQAGSRGLGGRRGPGAGPVNRHGRQRGGVGWAVPAPARSLRLLACVKAHWTPVPGAPGAAVGA
ncbi:WAS/WASL-interacting protein family member 3-like [Vulpes lagopus]|uniref:WAS/WASL-interacting protein family member 3-like n=1 Tax=Vulpes lagopus TaxID=494514 RepID=UPI001BC9BAAE|nr:WAS/WASL-interacting protein family member 3-like [Vulpes lagopus]